VVTSDPEVAREAAGLVVPGVGAFSACMEGLKKVGAPAIIADRYRDARPTLGICVGMQVLFSDSDENGFHKGIGMWETSVRKLQAPILPHMGWNTIEPSHNSTLFNGVEGESFYFVHSYAARETHVGDATYALHGEKFLAAVENGSLSATQFHPEKSGRAGLALIKNWSKSL
jgi:glutamine amidotransferase